METTDHSALPPMIDTHCHLDDVQFASDLKEVLKRSQSVNVNRWVLIGYDPARWAQAAQMATAHEGMYHTLGVHPGCAESWNDRTETELRDLLATTGACGIGEAGLDFYRDNAPIPVQARAFAAQLEIAVDLGLPLVIHMRAAEDEILSMLSDGRTLPTLVFHSFEGTGKLLDFVLETGSYAGIGGLATRQKAEPLRTLLKQVSMERILLETDSPYLVPARQKDRRNHPAHIATIATMMAGYLDTTAEALAVQTTLNAQRVFGITYD